MFAPVFRQSGRPSSLSHQQNHGRKRKRVDRDSDDEPGEHIASSPDAENIPQTPASSFRPVNRTDQYFVAGHSREQPVPGFPFPHAAAKPTRKPSIAAGQDLALLNPPLFVSKSQRSLQSTSLKRHHVENLTTILHNCMLRGDWKRASRTWGLLLRTEIGGRGIDIRNNGRWAVAAELLMRRDQESASPQDQVEPSQHHDQSDVAETAPEDDHSSIPDHGFKLAREYYERLILQYPHTTRTKHLFNALTVYPALFNIWVYEVQDRSNRERRTNNKRQPSSPRSDISAGSRRSSITDDAYRAVRKRELEDGLVIAQRLDELLLSPPCDTSVPLLHIRALAGLWLADLYLETSNNSNATIEIKDVLVARENAESERNIAARLLAKVKEGEHNANPQAYVFS